MTARKIDIRVYDQGTLIGFAPASTRASKWFERNVRSEPWQWLGSVLWVEHRFADELADGLRAEGFNIGGKSCSKQS